MQQLSRLLERRRSNGPPPIDVPASPPIDVTGDTYNLDNQNRNGSFLFFWPTQNVPNPCEF